MQNNIVVYADKLDTHMEQLLLDLCPEDIDMRFLQPSVGKQGTIEEANVIFCSTYKVDKNCIDSAPGLKLVMKPGAGLDNVDVAYATTKGIAVSCCPGMNKSTVAELVIGMLIALYRKIPLMNETIREGFWDMWKYRYDSFELAGKTMGVVGCGAIGREIVSRMNAFGVKSIYYDPYRLSPEMEKKLDLEFVELDEVLRRSDIVTLHLPLTPETRNMIGEAQFKMMKPTAVLVNAARGGIVDRDALANALLNHDIWGAVLDTHAVEPPDITHPLYANKDLNIIMTPHLGGATKENMERCFRQSFVNAQKAIAGEPVEFQVNKI